MILKTLLASVLYAIGICVYLLTFGILVLVGATFSLIWMILAEAARWTKR
jgi:hypothetical protein